MYESVMEHFGYDATTAHSREWPEGETLRVTLERTLHKLAYMLACVPPLDCFSNVCPPDLRPKEARVVEAGNLAGEFVDDGEWLRAYVHRGTICESSVSLQVNGEGYEIATSEISSLYFGEDAEGRMWFSSRPRLLTQCLRVERVQETMSYSKCRPHSDSTPLDPDLPSGVSALYLTGGFRSAVLASILAPKHLRERDAPMLAYCAAYSRKETEAARTVAKLYGLDLRVVYLSPFLDIDRAVRDAQTFDPPTVYRLHTLNALAAAAREDGVDTVFTGEGHSERIWSPLKQRFGEHSVGLTVRMPYLRRGVTVGDHPDVPKLTPESPREMLHEQRIRAVAFCDDTEYEHVPPRSLEERWLRAVYRRIFGEHMETCVDRLTRKKMNLL